MADSTDKEITEMNDINEPLQKPIKNIPVSINTDEPKPKKPRKPKTPAQLEQFEKHDKVYHELTVPILEDIYNQLNGIKEEFAVKVEKKKKAYQDDVSDSDEEEKEPQYSCIVIDDMANILKEKSIAIQLSKMIIKARHLCCSFIFTLQSYYYMPKILRKQITYTTIFKPKNIEEWNSIAKELLNLSKDDALKVYDYVFDENYNHIDIDLVTNK